MALSDQQLVDAYYSIKDDRSLCMADLVALRCRAVERAVREDVMRELGGGVDVEALLAHADGCDSEMRGFDCNCHRANCLSAIRTAVAQARVEWEKEPKP